MDSLFRYAVEGARYEQDGKDWLGKDSGIKRLVEKNEEKFIDALVYNPLVNAVREVTNCIYMFQKLYDKKFFGRGPSWKPGPTSLKYYLDRLDKDMIAEHQPRLLVLRLVKIYKKFYRDVARKAELLATGVEKIDKVMKGASAEEIVQCSDWSEDWNGLIRSSTRGDAKAAAFMIDFCDMFDSLNALQRQRV